MLPFANLSGDPAQDYFSDGTTEDVIAALGRFSDLSVIARSEVEKYKGQPLQLDELSRKLGVCYVLEGSLRKSGDRVLVTAQLIDALSGRLLWSVSHDGDLKDLFAVRNQITQNVVGKLAIKLLDIERRRALKKPTDSLDAYDYLLRGREYYARSTRSEFVREHHVGLHSFRSMRRMEARRRKASALRLRHSQSLASLRQRPSQARVRSTIQRLGRVTKPLA